MEQYKKLEKKAEHFLQSKTINTPEELDAMVDEFQEMMSNSKLHVVFRGMHEAKYKLYDSFQRMWIEYGLCDSGKDSCKFVQNMINRCFNRKHVLFKYFKQLGVICNDWLILSFLQHYGGASPLLDFSKNYKVALYFLCKDLKPYYGKEEINHYASIYYYKSVRAGKDFRSLEKIAEDIVRKKPYVDKVDIWKNELRFSSLMKPSPTTPITIPVYSLQSNITRTIKKKDGKIFRKKVTHFTAANINVTSQEGEFVCNMDMEQPLEDVFQKDGTKYICCYNIHKNLRQYIIDEYLDGSLEKHDNIFFPSEERIAREAFERTLENLNLAKTE